MFVLHNIGDVTGAIDMKCEQHTAAHHELAQAVCSWRRGCARGVSRCAEPSNATLIHVRCATAKGSMFPRSLSVYAPNKVVLRLRHLAGAVAMSHSAGVSRRPAGAPGLSGHATGLVAMRGLQVLWGALRASLIIRPFRLYNFFGRLYRFEISRFPAP